MQDNSCNAYPVIWERLRAPEGLGGEEGLYRLPRELLQVYFANDLAAIEGWLESSTVHTSKRIYRAAIEKLVNWAWLVRGKAVSSLDVEDFAAYSRFLRNPQPSDVWQCDAKARRDSAAWRPFLSGSTGGYETNLHIVSSLVDWLAEVGYARLTFVASERAFRGLMIRSGSIAKRARRDEAVPLDHRDAAIVWEAIGCARPHVLLRTQLQFLLQYQGGLTSTEVAFLLVDDVRRPAGSPWLIHVRSRPEETAMVAALPLVKTKLHEFLSSGTFGKSGALLQVSESDVSKANARFFELAATLCDGDEEGGRQAIGRLRALKGSAMRYAFAHHADHFGVLPFAWQMIAARRRALPGFALEFESRLGQPISAASYDGAVERLQPVLDLLGGLRGLGERRGADGSFD